MGDSRVTCAPIREQILWFKIDTNWCRNLYRLCESCCIGSRYEQGVAVGMFTRMTSSYII